MKRQNIFFIRIPLFFLVSLYVLPLYSNLTQLISLKAPSDKLTIHSQKIQFQWEWNHSEGFSQLPQQVEIHFWAKTGRFEKQIAIPSSKIHTDRMTYTIDSCRTVFRRHGRYYWKVVALLANGRQITSKTRSFYIGIPELLGKPSSTPFVYALQFDYIHRKGTSEYIAFIKTADPNSHLRSYSDFRMIFKQNNLGIPTFELEENLLILSQIGLGVDVNMRFKLFQTSYFSLSPTGGGGVQWSSTGIRDFSTSLYHSFVGGDLALMPRGFLVFKGRWIPHYHIRYAHVDGDLRTFQGEGWEVGVEFVISQNILKPFRILGMEIDLERIPIGFSISQVKDSYTGTKLEMRKLSIRYVLQ